MAKKGLELAGFITEVSRTGTDGVVRIMGRAFDLVLLDWVLGDMTGGEVLRIIRGAGFAIPVIVVSGFDERDAAFAAGANAFERKPFRMSALLPLIERLLAAESTTGAECSRRIFTAWTMRAVMLIDRVSGPLVSDEAQLDPAGRRGLLCQLGHSLADADVTIPEFRAGAGAFKLIAKTTNRVDPLILAEARKLVAVPPLDRTDLHDKVLKAIDRFESAARDAHPIREGLVAHDFGIAPGWLGELLNEQTDLAWDAWSMGAHLRDSVRGIVAGCRTIGRSATTEWGWSSRHHLYDSFRSLIGVGPRQFRSIVASAARSSGRGPGSAR